MKTTKVIKIRNSLIFSIGVSYCIVGGLMFLNFHFPYEIITGLPMILFIVSAIIVGLLIKKARGAWDERTKDQFYKLMTLAYGLTCISLALLINFSSKEGMVSVNQVAGIIMLGLGVPTILFVLGEWGTK
jgi:hypothetical protein